MKIKFYSDNVLVQVSQTSLLPIPRVGELAFLNGNHRPVEVKSVIYDFRVGDYDDNDIPCVEVYF